MTSRTPTILGLPRDEFEALINLSIDSGAIVAHVPADLVFVPDVMLIEAEANGRPFTPTTRIKRDDSRTCAVYRFPEVVMPT